MYYNVCVHPFTRTHTYTQRFASISKYNKRLMWDMVKPTPPPQYHLLPMPITKHWSVYHASLNEEFSIGAGWRQWVRRTLATFTQKHIEIAYCSNRIRCECHLQDFDDLDIFENWIILCWNCVLSLVIDAQAASCFSLPLIISLREV